MTTTRRRWHISALAAAALIVAACGGGDTDSPLASRVVVFGDSLSDIGTYTPATSLTWPDAPVRRRTSAASSPPTRYTDYALAPAGATRAPNTSNANTSGSSGLRRVLGVTDHHRPMSGFGPDTPQTRVRCPVTRSAPALAGQQLHRLCAMGGSRVTRPGRHQQPQRWAADGLDRFRRRRRCTTARW